ncbi:hypothetical protein HPP92_008275 [Vanilla planifolia]|uniref:DCL protein n=1 Tax=Vanilla planifolia TaxID=51239 RepID=A0A835V5V2_VANPL|nr:hypothetical protein HPP92_008275 [Vanilla planifolia]
MAFAAAHVRLRGFLLLRAHVLKTSLPRLYTVAISSLEATQPLEPGASVGEGATWTAAVGGVGGVSHPMAPKKQVRSWEEHPEYRRWKNKEEEILRDIEPIMFLTKDILHSDKYHDGERLCPEDEKEVVEKLLAYHPYSKDKIGCGFDSIMVDRHPQFSHSRCLFVVRTDGGWIDFSYQKCLRAYIREKYPSYAERFIKEHFKRT